MSTIPIAQPAINTLLQRGNAASPEVFTTVANVGDMSWGLQANVVDVTSHSTGVPWHEKLTTLLDGGDVTFPLFFVPSSSGQAGHNDTSGLMEDFTNRTIRNWKLIFPDQAATTYYFSASINKFQIESKVADVLRASVSFAVTGEPTFA